MLKHRETHPNLDVDGCFGCRVAHVAISAEATPTRRPHAARTTARERAWDTDMAAYKRLRQDGVQPQKIDGSRHVEQRAEERWQVETGIV